MSAPHIALLGASGLIGHALAVDLQRRGFAVRGIARHFIAAQVSALNGQIVQSPLMTLTQDALASLLSDADIVVNCIGILQDGYGDKTDTVHRAFSQRLSGVCAPGKLLLHLSIPGNAPDDRTAYSTSKRAAEQVIAQSQAPFVILRPGFVIAATAYGGSALIRALAALPFGLPAREAQAPFAAIAVTDICETVARVAARWRSGEKAWRKTWDVMEDNPGTVGDIVAAFRDHGGGPKPYFSVPGWTLAFGVRAGDFAARLGWKPPIRSTAILEMRRGVTGDPRTWMIDTGIQPLSAKEALAALPASIQEKWFARLYLLKAVSIATLVIFWCVSGLIALTVAFGPARDILLSHGFSLAHAQTLTIASSVMDILVGLAIASRASCRAGLTAGIAVSLFYMVGSALLTPELWVEPLGALVKTGPAIILMLICLALLDDR